MPGKNGEGTPRTTVEVDRGLPHIKHSHPGLIIYHDQSHPLSGGFK